MRSFDFTHAIVRRPAPSAVRGLRAQDGPDPDFAALAREHAVYVAALREAGLAVTELEPLEEFPDALFVEDPALVFPEAAIVLRPGAPSRIGEAERLRPALAAAFDRVIDLPRGFADGGDVLTIGKRVFIGLSARTDREGAEALSGVLRELGYIPQVAETPPSVLHLKTACSLIDEETVLATADLAASGLFAGYRVLRVPPGEHAGANVLRVNDRLIVGAGFPRLIELLGGTGARLLPLQNSAIAMIDAGFTCMSLRWRASGRQG